MNFLANKPIPPVTGGVDRGWQALTGLSYVIGHFLNLGTRVGHSATGSGVARRRPLFSFVGSQAGCLRYFGAVRLGLGQRIPSRRDLDSTTPVGRVALLSLLAQWVLSAWVRGASSLARPVFNFKALALLAIATLFCINVNAQANAGYIHIVAIVNTNGWEMTNELDGSVRDENGRQIIPPKYIVLRSNVRTEIVTNWTTTGTIWPNALSQINPDGTATLINYSVYQATGYVQSGTIISNTIAEIEWRDKWIPVVVESKSVGNESRTIWK